MSIFFGTDGLRGVVNIDLNHDVAYKCGNSLSRLCPGGRVIIGKDTRTTGDFLLMSLAAGLIDGGAQVVDAGILPTAAVAYLTKTLGFDYGIMLTASHNPAEYNGIKIFSSKGEKLEKSEEEKVERGLILPVHLQSHKIGTFKRDENLKKKYLSFLLQTASCRLDGLKIVLDCSNGASYKLAPALFKKLGATVIKSACTKNGKKINDHCGSLYPEVLASKVKKYSANFGLAFDGDADRIIAVTKSGQVVDGDKILTTLAKCLFARGELNHNTVVGTSLTNMGVEAELGKYGIKLLRADVGDKYVAAAMNKEGLSLGGEQSGHMIISKYLRTGDGLLTALLLCCYMQEAQKDLEEFCHVDLYPQVIKSLVVSDKLRVLGSEVLTNAIASVQQELAGCGRVLVRASGTEPKIRIMIESLSKSRSMALADYLAEVILSLENTEA